MKLEIVCENSVIKTSVFSEGLKNSVKLDSYRKTQQTQNENLLKKEDQIRDLRTQLEEVQDQLSTRGSDINQLNRSTKIYFSLVNCSSELPCFSYYKACLIFHLMCHITSYIRGCLLLAQAIKDGGVCLTYEACLMILKDDGLCLNYL